MANGQLPSANITMQAADSNMQSASSSYWDWWIPNFGNWLPHKAPAEDVGRRDVAIEISQTASDAAAVKCAQMCRSMSAAEASERQHVLQRVLPLVPLTAHDATLLRCVLYVAAHTVFHQSATTTM